MPSTIITPSPIEGATSSSSQSGSGGIAAAAKPNNSPSPSSGASKETKKVTAKPHHVQNPFAASNLPSLKPVVKPVPTKGPSTYTKKPSMSTKILERELERKAEAKRHALSTTTTPTKPNRTTSDNISDTPRGHFALSTLYPLKSKAGSKKKWVELYCKGLKEVVCCFRGHHDAAAALNLDRKTVRKMCEKVGDDVPIFPTFALLHASNRILAPAYHYGVHVEDHSSEPETYEARLKRFRRVHQQDRKKEDEQLAFHGPKTAVVPTNEVPLSFLKEKDLKKRKVGHDRNNDNLMVTVAEDEDDLLQRDFQGICIFCQENRADIVFHPCLHSVLCEECHLRGNICRKFCPVCRTKLKSSTKPEKIKFVRPRIFSAYAFAGDL